MDLTRIDPCGLPPRALTSDLSSAREAASAAATVCRGAEQRAALLAGKLASRDESLAAAGAELRAIRAVAEEERQARAVDTVALAASRGQVRARGGESRGVIP